MDANEIAAHLAAMTEHQKKILELLYLVGKRWLTRSEIARSMGKRRLNPYDLECLALLSEKGFITISRRPSKVPGIEYAHIYQVTPEAASGIKGWVELGKGE